MLSRLFGRGASDDAAYGHAAILDEGGYEVVSAVVDGRQVTVFVAPQGTAAAVEVGETRAMVLTGLAAGIVLSDVEEAVGEARPARGLSAASMRTRRLSARDADGRIDAIGVLSEGQKDQLRAALSL